jgi:hypothetical protein
VPCLASPCPPTGLLLLALFKISVSRCQYQGVRLEWKDSFGSQIIPSWAVDVQKAVKTRNGFLTRSESPSITLSEIRSPFLLLAARQPFKMGLFVRRDCPFTQDGPLDTDSEYRIFRTRQEARVRSEYKARQGTRRQGSAAPYRRGRLTLDLIKKPRSRVRKGRTQATSRDLYIQDDLLRVHELTTIPTGRRPSTMFQRCRRHRQRTNKCPAQH